MARWQDLFEMLLDEDLSAGDIISRLGVKPSRLRRLIRSKRLEEQLRMVESVADCRAGHAVITAIDPAVGKLAALTNAERPETARRACLDVLEKAKQVYRAERKGRG